MQLTLGGGGGNETTSQLSWKELGHPWVLPAGVWLPGPLQVMLIGVLPANCPT